MDQFNKLNIGYTPLEISNGGVASNATSSSASEDADRAIAQKLLDHLSLIQDYRDRLDAIDYLTDNAEKLSGDIRYVAKDSDVIRAIKDFGGKDNTVDFDMFKQAIEIVINGYKQMALVALTGVNNA